MKKTRVILALLMAMMVVLGGLFMAAADEGQGSMDVSPGSDEPPVVEPTDEPIDEPTDEPTTEPTDEPTTEPTDEPTTEPTDGPTDEPTTEPTDEPTAEPTEEPTPEPPIDDNTGGGDNGDNQGSATRPSINMGGSIRQPSTSSRRPISSSSQTGGSQGDSSTQAPADDGPQYVTFARVTQKSNAMSRTLFYSGAACVGTGVLGLIVLVVFVIRGRGGDEREEIFAEIEQAAVRQPVQPRQRQRQVPREVYEDDPYAQYDQQQEYDGYDGGGYEDQGYRQAYARGYDNPPPSLHRPEPEELAVPVNGSVYTEEFELPPQQAGYQEEYQQEGPVMPPEASMYTEEFEPPRQVPPSRGPIMPTQASMYTEEFSLPGEMEPSQPVQRRPARQAPAPRPEARPRPAAKVPPEQMDTTELLREILYGDDKK